MFCEWNLPFFSFLPPPSFPPLLLLLPLLLSHFETPAGLPNMKITFVVHLDTSVQKHLMEFSTKSDDFFQKFSFLML